MLYTLRSRLVVAFILLLVLPFVTMVLVLSQLSNAVIGESISESTANTMNQYTGFVDTLTMQVDDVANQVLSSDLTQEWIAAQLDSNIPMSRKITLDAELRKYLSSIALNNTVISSIAIFDHEGQAVGIRDQVFRDPAYLDSQWYRQFVEDDRRWVSTHLDPYQPFYLQQEMVNSLLFPVLLLKNFNNVGVMKINFLSTLIQEPLNQIKFGQSGRLYIVDRAGEPVFNHGDYMNSILQAEDLASLWEDTRNQGEVHLKLGRTTHILFFQKLKADWLLVGEVPEKELYHTLTNTRNTMLIISGILLFLTIIAAYWISSGIAKPLSKLAFAMRYVEREDFKRAELGLKPYVRKRNEIGYVTTVFLAMVSRVRFLIETEYRSNIKRKDAEFKALLMQINPHFLYNTLEIIGGLAAQKRTEEVIDVSESLGKMLRFSLRLDSDFVVLKDEFQYLREYIAIMTLRFGDRLQVNIHEDDEVKHAVMIKFMLQPLVENAIKYSIEFAQTARIDISAEKRGDRLYVQIADNGRGMSEVLVQDILRPADRNEDEPVLHTAGQKIGVRNVLARCRLIYGEQFEVVIHTAPDQGTLIEIAIPFRNGV